MGPSTGYFSSRTYFESAPTRRCRSNHGSRRVGLGRPGLAARRLCRGSAEFGWLNLSARAGNGWFRRRVKTEGYHRWTESEIEQFEAQHMIGSRARLAFALLLYTGQRRSDVVRMGRQHIRDGALQVRYRRVCHCNQRREQTRQTVRRQHTCVRRGAASVQSRRYHKNLLCAEWAAQWCTERPLLARRLLAKPLPHIPEVSRRVTAAEFGS